MNVVPENKIIPYLKNESMNIYLKKKIVMMKKY